MKRFLKILFAILLFPVFLIMSIGVGLVDLYSMYDDIYDADEESIWKD